MSIVSIETMRARGRAAALRGESQDSHGMNWNADAVTHWLEGHDAGTVERLEAEREASHESHIAPAGRRGVELCQEAV